jgi:hypothetical protein
LRLRGLAHKDGRDEEPEPATAPHDGEDAAVVVAADGPRDAVDRDGDREQPAVGRPDRPEGRRRIEQPRRGDRAQTDDEKRQVPPGEEPSVPVAGRSSMRWFV